MQQRFGGASTVGYGAPESQTKEYVGGGAAATVGGLATRRAISPTAAINNTMMSYAQRSTKSRAVLVDAQNAAAQAKRFNVKRAKTNLAQAQRMHEANKKREITYASKIPHLTSRARRLKVGGVGGALTLGGLGVIGEAKWGDR